MAASAMSDLSRIWCQMRFTLTSKLFIIYHGCVNTHDKVNVSTQLWDVDHSLGWRKYIQLWDLDHSVGWRKATRGIPDKKSAKNHRPGVAWFCQQRGSKNKNSTCPTTWDNSEATSLFLLKAPLGREVPANQTLRIAVDVRDGVVVIVFPVYLGAANYRLHGKVSEDSLCRRHRSWPYD